MKGLLAKDICIMLERKNYFIMIFGLGLVFMFSSSEAFAIAYTTMIAAFFTVSTISYDEYDNCYPFLFTLPIDAESYVKEKYLYGAILCFSCWLFFTLVWLIKGTVTGEITDMVSEILGFGIVPLLAYSGLDLCIPINFKYGMEKGKTVLYILFGAAAVIMVFFGGSYGAKYASGLIEMLNKIGPKPIFFIVLVIFVIATIVSVRISRRIIQNKEF